MSFKKGGIRNTLSAKHSSMKFSSFKQSSIRKFREVSTPLTGTTIQQPESSVFDISEGTSRHNRMTQTIFDRNQIVVSCLGEIDIRFGHERVKSLDFFKLLRKSSRNDKNSIIYDLHPPVNKDRKGCWDSCCPTRKKWLSNIILYGKEFKNLQELQNSIAFKVALTGKSSDQIQRDVPRSFPENMFPKTKITIYHAASQKNSIFQTLKTVLQLYSAFDKEVGYVQGLNIVAGVIVIHMKDVDSSFIYLKEIMNYGKLRVLYIEDMHKVKQLSNDFFDKILPEAMPDLYEHMVNPKITQERCNVQPLMVVPPYYLTIFASVVDIHYMVPFAIIKHIMIDQFMIQGVDFLHKMMLSLLAYLKDRLIFADEDILVMLGPSWIKDAKIPWEQVIQITKQIKLPTIR